MKIINPNKLGLCNMNNDKLMKKKWFIERGEKHLFIKWLRIMKLTAFMLLITCLHLSASVYSQQTMLDISLENTSVREMLKLIEDQSNYFFLYTNDDIDVDRKVSIHVKGEKVADILDRIFAKTDVRYQISDRQIVLTKENGNGFFSGQQQKTISGRVTDTSGEPLPGVTVVIKGTMQGTVTDFDGNYSIPNVPATGTLVFSFVGMKSQEIVVGNQSSINLVMEQDAIGIEEVVAVGYGTMKRSSLTGSISKVNANDIEDFPVVNVVDAIQGRAAGVYVSPSRQPGENPSITIRGTRSLSASNDPLLIVDGMPGSWDNLVSNDIASMEILKDAAATAVYGSRASNGVILVTTKSAAMGLDQFSVELSSYAGVNSYNFIEMQSAESYAELIRDVVRYQAHGAFDKQAWENSNIDTETGLRMFHSAWHENYYEKGINYDWQKALFENSSFLTGHNLSIGNRTEKLALRLTYNFQDDNSYYKTVNYKKHSLNTNIKLNLTDWMEVGVISRLSVRKHTGWPDNMWENFQRMTPFETPWINDDQNNGLKDIVGKENYVNALWNYEEGYLIDEREQLMGDMIFTAEIKPLDWLTFSTNLKLDFSERKNGNYRDSKTSYQNLGSNFASMEKGQESGYTWNAILNVEKTYDEKHKFMGTAVIETIENTIELVGAQSQDIPASYMGYHFLETGIINRDLWTEFSKYSLLSYMFRGQYEFNGKYLFNAAARIDGSSRLAKDNQWRTFPSFSAAWILSEEDFMQSSSLSFLKLRWSYGEVGNQAIAPYQTMTTLSQAYYSWNKEGIFTWLPSGLANEALGWEVSKTWNLGLDFRFANNLIYGEIEYYNTSNEDLLMQRTLPQATGFGSIWQNVGETLNQGFELSLNSSLINRRDLNWTVSGMVSRNWNEIISLTEEQDDPRNQWFIGQPIDVIWDFKKIGIWQLEESEEALSYNAEPGIVKVEDKTPDGVITDADKYVLGQTQPKVLTSFQSSLQFKRWDFSVNLVGQFGHMFSTSNYFSTWNGDKPTSTNVDWWTPLNPTNEWPRMHASQTHDYTSTLSYYDADFIKVQEMTVGYDLRKISTRLKKLRIYAQARNPFYVYKACPQDINPEEPNSMYTIPASYVLGINLGF